MSRHWNALGKWIRRIKIRSRLLYSFLILSLFPLITIGFFSISKSSDAIFTKMNTSSYQIMSLLKDKVRAENQKFVLLSEQLTLNPVIQSAMQHYLSYDDTAKRDIAVKIDAILRDKYEMLSSIKNVIVTTTAGDTVFDLGYDAVDVRYLTAQNEIIDASGNGGYVLGHAMTKRGVPCILLSRPVNSTSDWSQRLGYVHILIDEAFYSLKLYHELDMGEGSMTFITDSEGQILSSRSSALPVGSGIVDDGLLEPIIRSAMDTEQMHSVEFMSGKYLVSASFDIFADWYLVSLIPYDYLNSETYAIRLDIAVVCLIVLVLACGCSYYLSSTILRPLARLVSSMRRIQDGELYVKAKDDSRDEVGTIHQIFNDMVLTIQRLLAQTEAEEKAKRETELQMLQAQINPHFLFNTLNSLKWAAMISQTGGGVADGLGALAQLLRNTIVDKAEFVTLEEELDNIKNYIIIQKIKYGSFEVHYEVDPDLRHYRVLKFLLQPIVENSIIHGLSEAEGGGEIRIICRSRGGCAEIVIMDNGAGMNEMQLSRLRREQRGHGERLANIGIHNVEERIKLYFGKEYGLHIESEAGRGTTTTLTLPLNPDMGRPVQYGTS
ncbi:sensor histidine kinase [Paenibacillus cisolokensis]|uniref:cache domain-containing sensor histidine kinase n=1 Tax=Paenibacillus cisolokensis TaxID=1658519 RepID=UPI003D28B791